MGSLYDNIFKRLSECKNSVALSYYGKKINANQFLTEVDWWASIFLNKYKLKQGDVVAMNLPNIPNAVILFYALNKIGVIVSLMHPLLPFMSVKKNIQETNSKMLITSDYFFEENKKLINSYAITVLISRMSDYLPAFKKAIFCLKRKIKIPKELLYTEIYKYNKNIDVSTKSNKDIAVYMHSSGTTDQPKIIILSNSAINALSDMLPSVIVNPDTHNKCIMVLPLFHGFGLAVCLHTMLSHGAEIALLPKFNVKDFARIVSKRGITISAGVPLMYLKLLKASDHDFKKLKTLENIFVGGDKLNQRLKEDFNNRMASIGSNAKLREGYGLTETVTVCCVQAMEDKDNSSMGKPLDGIDVCIIDEQNNLLPIMEEGEICVAGPTLMNGYLKDKTFSTFIKMGDKQYVKTGDIGFLDECGALHFLGRKKRISKLKGINIFPAEIEELIKNNSNVEECVVLIKDEKVYIVVQADIQNQSLIKNKIIDVCTKYLIKYSIPFEENIFVLRNIPKTQIGKIDFKSISEIIKTKQ